MVTDTPDPSVVEAREALWRWYAFGEFEKMDLDAITDEQYDQIESSIEAAMEALCDAAGHHYIFDNCGKPEHQFCLYCRNLIPEEEIE